MIRISGCQIQFFCVIIRHFINKREQKKAYDQVSSLLPSLPSFRFINDINRNMLKPRDNHRLIIKIIQL